VSSGSQSCSAAGMQILNLDAALKEETRGTQDTLSFFKCVREQQWSRLQPPHTGARAAAPLRFGMGGFPAVLMRSSSILT
jgi:hypothetical protein